MGLAGMFIVNDAEEASLNLPGNEYEIPLVIQDKRIYADYSLNYSPTSDEVMTGYFGAHVLVNGIWGTSPSSFPPARVLIHITEFPTATT